MRRGAIFATASTLFKAVVAAAAAANQQGRVGLLFPAQWTPENIVASVAHVEPTAVTYALDCPPKASDDCSLFIQTMTQGPQTWAYSGEWENIMGVDEYTLNNECAVRQKNDRMVCTLGVTQVKGGKTASTEIVSTTTGLSDFVYPIPITAGIGKLEDQPPKPTKTSHTAPVSTSSFTTVTSVAESTTASAEPMSVPISSVLPTVNLAAADATKDAAAAEPTKDAEEDRDGLIEGTPSVVPTAAASASRAQASLVGLAAFVSVMLVF